MNKIIKNQKAIVVSITFAFMAIFHTGCSIGDLYQKPVEGKYGIPKPVSQYFNEEDGALSRYISWIEEKKESGEIGLDQYEVYMDEINAVRQLVKEAENKPELEPSLEIDLGPVSSLFLIPILS